MTTLPERRIIIELIQEAVQSGARLSKACDEAQIALRTYRRWFQAGMVQADQRPETVRAAPSNKLSDEEQDAIIKLCNQSPFVDLPPTQIVPALMDQGVYVASESSFYRVLKKNGQQYHRGRSRAPQGKTELSTHIANAPCEVWCWDITYCASQVRGRYFYLYMFMDIYSRKLVGYEVYEEESGAHAVTVLQRALLSEQCFNTPIILHSDNGAPMKSQTLKIKLEELGVLPSYSRPRVSNDNAYAESVFRTLKYRPQWPSNGFKDLADVRQWVERFVHWYNHEHKHSKIRFVTPQQRHSGQDQQILDNRKVVLEKARNKTPSRWGGREIRNCTAVGAVMLNPDRVQQISNEELQAA
jgi:transposase InsO family protein